MAVLKGIDNVLRNLNKEIKAIENRTQAGLTAAALKVKAESMKLTPRDTGNLRASAYVISGGSQIGSAPEFMKKVGGKLVKMEFGAMHETHLARRKSGITLHGTVKMPSAEIGYTASYAIFVHEIDNNYTVGQWKFLETALFSNQKEILRIIKGYAKIK